MAESSLQGYLNKSLTCVIFSNNPELNLTANDLGGDEIVLKYDTEGVERHDTMVGQVVSVNFFRAISIDIPIIKTSMAYQVWSDLVEKGNCFIQGSVTYRNDVGRIHTFTDISIQKGDDSGSGTKDSTSFTLKGTQKCNQGVFYA